MADDLIETLPPGPLDKPVEEWTAGELLSDTAREGLMRCRAIIMQPLRLKESVEDELSAADLKLQRLVGDMSMVPAKLLARVHEAALRDKRETGFAEMLKKLLETK